MAFLSENHSLLLIGGQNVTDKYDSFSSTKIIHFANQTKHCSEIPDFGHSKLFSQGIVMMNGSLFICGGWMPGGNFSNDCHILIKNKWEESHSMIQSWYKD